MISSEYFWLYKVSYLYNGVMGFLITMVIGYLVSYVARKVTGEVVAPMDPNLFVPPLAKKMERLWDKPLNTNTMTLSDEDLSDQKKFDMKVVKNIG